MSKILHYCRYNKKSVTKHVRAESLPRSQFSDHKSCESGKINFSDYHVSHVGLANKCLCGF